MQLADFDCQIRHESASTALQQGSRQDHSYAISRLKRTPISPKAIADCADGLSEGIDSASRTSVMARHCMHEGDTT